MKLDPKEEYLKSSAGFRRRLDGINRSGINLNCGKLGMIVEFFGEEIEGADPR